VYKRSVGPGEQNHGYVVHEKEEARWGVGQKRGLVTTSAGVNVWWTLKRRMGEEGFEHKKYLGTKGRKDQLRRNQGGWNRGYRADVPRGERGLPRGEGGIHREKQIGGEGGITASWWVSHLT